MSQMFATGPRCILVLVCRAARAMSQGVSSHETCCGYSGGPHIRFLFWGEGSLCVLGFGVPSRPNPSSGAVKSTLPGPREGSSILNAHLVVMSAAVCPRGPKSFIFGDRAENGLILGVQTAPWLPKTHGKGWGLRPPPFAVGFGEAGGRLHSQN